MGQADCYEVLMRRHNRTMYRIGKMYGLDDQTTEDLMQQTHTAAYEAIATFDPAWSYRNWISGLMTDNCRQHLRQAEQFETDDYQETEAAEDTVVAEPVVTFARTSTLQKHIEQLPFALRAPLILCEIEGFSIPEAASLLGTDEEVLRSRLQRGKSRLRGRLLKWYYNSDVFNCQSDCNDRVVALVMRQLS